jgi:hypothetical protein
MRFGLAAFGAVLIGGIAVGLAVLGSTDNTKSSQLHVRRAVAAGAPVSQVASHSSSPVPTVQVARPTITQPLRDMRSSTLKANTAFNKVLEHSRAENLTIIRGVRCSRRARRRT